MSTFTRPRTTVAPAGSFGRAVGGRRDARLLLLCNGALSLGGYGIDEFSPGGFRVKLLRVRAADWIG